MEPAFLNNQEMVVDTKMRVGIPERFMKVLKQGFPDACEEIGVTATPDRSIKLMPKPTFLKELEFWETLDDQINDQRTILNLLTSFADLVPLDKQNRIRLSPALCKFCNITRNVIVVGNIRYMQIFDLDTWNDSVREGMDRFGGAINALALQRGRARAEDGPSGPKDS